jgi:glycosyl-4,4'-diaponeurosporenoate acyltransferase
MAPQPLLTSGLLWLIGSLLIGALANRLPASALARDGVLTRSRPWGESTEGYERRLGIRFWKNRLPDAGNALPGGVTKAQLVTRDRQALERLVAETRRAELVHLALWPLWLITPLWLPPAGVLINLLFATLFNLPCLWLQRYNRLRLQQLLSRMEQARGC